MAEESSVSTLGLLSLPIEVLHVIGEYLRPKDLLALSAVCRYLRSVLNVNSLWRKYTDSGVVSHGLTSIVSAVEPRFENPCSTSLEPLCDHRIHFLKQSRLLSNLRQSKFVEHSTEFHGYLSDFETVKPVNNRQVTYKSKFLFLVDYEGDIEVIKVLDIELCPQLLLTVNLEDHTGSYCVVTWVHVVGEKLLIRRDEWFDIYDIKLPECLKLSCSINVDGHGSLSIHETLILRNFLFVENSSANVVNVWDISNGSRCNDILPKINGPDFAILGHSQDQKLVIFSVGILEREPSEPHVFVYDIDSQDYSSFKPVLNRLDFKCCECHGLINSDYLVILNQRSDLNYSAFVFDCRNSNLVAEKTNLVTRRIEDAKIIDEYLVLPSLVSVLVMRLGSLQTVWELQLDSMRNLIYEFPVITMEVMEVMHLSTLTSIIIVHSVTGVEMWEFHSKKKFLQLPVKGVVALNDSCSKLILCDLSKLTILSFW